MTGQQAAYAAPLVLSVLTCATVLALIWRRLRSSSAMAAFGRAVVGQLLWGAGYVGELFATSLAGKQAWDALQVLPSYLVGLEMLRFVLAYTGSKLLESRRAIIALWALPAVHLAVVYTSPFHHAAYSDARLVPGPAFDVLAYSFTPLDQLGYFYLAVLAFSGAVLLPALAEKLTATQPWLRVLFASGYHEESLSRRSDNLATSRVLAKPFSLHELARAVRQTLEPPPS